MGHDEPTSGPETSRRSILRTVGAGTAGSLLLTGTSLASSEAVSVREAGIADEFNDHVANARMDEAFALLEAHNVAHEKVTDSLSVHQEPDYYDDSVSTNDWYQKDGTDVTFYTSVWDESSDEYAIGLSWGLERPDWYGDPDGPTPVDVPVLAFEQDIFGYVDDSAILSGKLQNYSGTNSVDGKTDLLSEPGSPEPDAPANGLVAEFHDAYSEDRDGNGTPDWFPVGIGAVQIRVTKQNTGTTGIVAGLYTHTWSIFDVANWDILANTSITIPGTGISVGVPWSSDKWELPNQDNRDQNL
ncbi:hypothetical protein [Haloarchaeobius litoreus]|uniref:Tat (Twin-arginine translocation) pathway signal sequence n=1 Tax=Haloarchaeobius litoreus TaxID=755306 RepID=A0ABD6DP65_9EURY|nr:hypothetical protein [Haloarchaeobius litoreus]